MLKTYLGKNYVPQNHEQPKNNLLYKKNKKAMKTSFEN
jgi:hypothetical protein